ncbi:FAD binding domain-containing protein [Actinophytocola sp.]|uniref:FAD binding domain-containing protein n=1 Tax=Actinophytocola sp. TaxID=1872138 RepID=UPI0039C86636
MTELRAGGTDLTERRRSGVSRGPVRDIGRRPELDRLDVSAAGELAIGALVTVARLADAPQIRSGYPGLAAAAAGLATPQVRRMATVGGNLMQHNRCWYYRHPAVDCLRKGGTGCPARTGNHLHGVVFDLGPCVAPHPSTLGAALLAYDAEITTDRRSLDVAEVFDPDRHHTLEPGELLTAIRLPAPVPGELAAYRRTISRAWAEWPLVEAVTRLVIAGDVISKAAVAVGGVAPVPLRLPHVESALTGRPPTPETLAAAAAMATRDATPLPMTGYKLPLLVTTVEDALVQAGQPQLPRT